MDDDISPEPDWPTASSPPASQPTQNTSHEPACDQCRIRKVRCNREHPKCSNCRRAKVACGFSNKGKRVNHTTKLVNEVDVLGQRLDKIEGAITRCVGAVEQMSNITTSEHSSKTRSPDGGNDMTAPSRPRSSDTNADSTFPGENARAGLSEHESHYLIVENGGYERSIGVGSMYSIWVEIVSETEKLLASQQPSAANPRSLFQSQDTQSPPKPSVGITTVALDPSLRSALQSMYEGLQMCCAESSSESCSDEGPLSLPPRFVLESILDAFLQELNSILPIFARSSFLEAIRIQYGPQQERIDPAWTTCFNNVILQMLTVKANAGTGRTTRNTMDETLRLAFLTNAQRCYTNLERLLKPRVVNVQALLSMAIVALKYFRYSVFETLFSLACQVAKAIGLHQQVHATSLQETSETERHRLFWTLFIMDKQLTLMCGTSCQLHGFDCDIPLPACGPTTELPLQDHFVASIRLAFVNEDIHRNLYSAESARASDTQHQRKVEMLSQKLGLWEAENRNLLDENSNRSSLKSSAALELRYAMLNSRILVLRRSRYKESKTQLLLDARTSLSIVKTLCKAPVTVSSSEVIERIFLHYPPVAFGELYKSILEDISTKAPQDSDLLLPVAELINCRATGLPLNSHLAKLKTATTLCSDVCMNIKGVKELGVTAQSPSSGVAVPDQSPIRAGPSELYPLPLDQPANTSMLTDDFMWDTGCHLLSESGATMPEILSSCGKQNFSSDIQFPFGAHTLPLSAGRCELSSGTYDACGAVLPHAIQPIFPAPLGPETVQNFLGKDWQPTIIADQMDFTSYIDNMGGV